jgi:hypothetical protein
MNYDEILSRIRICLYHNCVWAGPLPGFESLLHEWDLGFGPLHCGLSFRRSSRIGDSPCYAGTMKGSTPREIQLHPDAWERFERFGRFIRDIAKAGRSRCRWIESTVWASPTSGRCQRNFSARRRQTCPGQRCLALARGDSSRLLDRPAKGSGTSPCIRSARKG